MAARTRPTRNETKAKLLEAATSVFARVGFHAATVQEICEKAGANIAAVNYHFGDKLGLYREIMRSSHQSAHGGQPPVDGSLPAELRLQLFVSSLLQHLFGEGRPAWFAQVIAHEMAQPTPALQELIEQEARPGFEQLKKIVTEIVGVPATKDEVVLCANSIMGQCLHYFHARPVVSELWPELKLQGERIDQIAKHVTRFSMLALTQIAQDNARRPRASLKRTAEKRK